MSENLQDIWGRSTPWLLGDAVRIPRVKFPAYQEGKYSLPTPGRSLILIAIYIFLFWLTTGGIYIYIRDPIALGADAEGKAMWLYPSTHDAFIIDSIVAAAIIFIAGFGFLLLYNATKHSFNYSYAIKQFILGLISVILSFGMLQWMIDQKGG